MTLPMHMLPLDSRLEHRAAGAAALTATTVLDTVDQTVAVRTEFTTRVYLESVKISANNEDYKLVAEVSSDNFATVNEVAGVVSMGATEVRQSGAPDNAIGDHYDLHWSTEVNGTKYRYWRIRLIQAGTSPSMGLICYSSVRRG